MTPRLDGERAALADLPVDDPLLVAQRRRLVDALEEARIAAYLLGLDYDSLQIPFAIRADAWLTRARRLLEATAGLVQPFGSGLDTVGSGAIRTASDARHLRGGSARPAPPDRSGRIRTAADAQRRLAGHNQRTRPARSGAHRPAGSPGGVATS